MPFGLSPFLLIAQAIGILGMLAQTGSFAFKDVKKLYVSQCLAAGLTIIHYLMIGGYSGMAMNMVGFVRCLCLGSKKPLATGRLALIGILAFNAILGCFTLPSEGLIGLLPIIAQLIGTCSLWTRNNRTIHLIQLLLLSPAWATYAVVAGSLSGLLNEILTVLTILYYFVRYHGQHPNEHS